MTADQIDDDLIECTCTRPDPTSYGECRTCRRVVNPDAALAARQAQRASLVLHKRT